MDGTLKEFSQELKQGLAEMQSACQAIGPKAAEVRNQKLCAFYVEET